MVPGSIRWRLPLTYAGIALLTALALGGVLLVILRDSYRRQEVNYLVANVQAMDDYRSPAAGVDCNRPMRWIVGSKACPSYLRPGCGC